MPDHASARHMSAGTSVAAIGAARDWVELHLAALALGSETPKPLPLFLLLATLLVHLAGLAAFWRYYHQPVWLAIPTLASLLLGPMLALRSKRELAVETLAPLFFLYAILVARVMAVRVLLADEPYQDEASFADPRFIAFQVEATAAAVAAYTALAQANWLTRGIARRRLLVGLSFLLAFCAMAWFALEVLGHATVGVTATDPFVYVQMAVDLATNGTPVHSFALFPYVVNLNVSWYPIEHMGYRLFDNLSGNVASVWPIGGSVLLALAYRAWGEAGLYMATPILSLVSLAACGMFAWEYLSDWCTIERAAVAAITVGLLATSWEQVDRSIVPLVDTQAQLFTVLAMLFAFMGARKVGDWLIAPLLTGLALGAAYWIRHTQVLLAIPIVVAVAALPPRQLVRFLAITGIAALVVALPDLWYHHQYMGSWLTPESNELALFGPSSIGPSVDSLSARFLAGNEFGYLLLFLMYGTIRAAMQNKNKFLVLFAWLVALGGFHMLYAAVKIRDLLPEYPAVILLTALGMVASVHDLRSWAGNIGWRRAMVALALFLALLLPAMRDRITIMRPFQPAKVTFGYMSPAQRSSFDQIASLTPADAVVGSTMNDGPIDLYARRSTFRPGAWNAEERVRFVNALLDSHRDVYLLDDGTETSAVRHDFEKRYTVRQVAVLDVPLFGEMDGTPGALYKIDARSGNQ